MHGVVLVVDAELVWRISLVWSCCIIWRRSYCCKHLVSEKENSLANLAASMFYVVALHRIAMLFVRRSVTRITSWCVLV